MALRSTRSASIRSAVRPLAAFNAVVGVVLGELIGGLERPVARDLRDRDVSKRGRVGWLGSSHRAE
jgi:hypothetical protein